MKKLRDFITESTTINESNPRGEFKVTKPFPTDDCWEYYAVANNDDPDADLEELQPLYDESEFENFIAYAEKKRWKTDKNGYFIIPKGTELYFSHEMDMAPHIGMFEVNGDKINGKKVYYPMVYDSVKYGDYDDYLEEI